MEKNLIIFTDSGDTIIDEGTEVRNKDNVVIHAETIPGAAEWLNKGREISNYHGWE